jgi:choline dehydrogenase
LTLVFEHELIITLDAMACFHNCGSLKIDAVILVITAILLFPSLVETTDTRNGSNEYDYIVIGSGPGGGPLASNLAKANYSVLLLEAGDTSVASNGTQYPSTITWDFFVNHYSKDDEINHRYSHFTWRTPDGSYWVGQKDPPPGSLPLGVYYPRGGK